jgi:magnesium-transporting ATPase (P-type)
MEPKNDKAEPKPEVEVEMTIKFKPGDRIELKLSANTAPTSEAKVEPPMHEAELKPKLEAKAPDAKASEAKAPDAKAPEAKAPNAKASEANAPEAKPDEKDNLKSMPLSEVEKKLESSPDGLTQSEAEKRLRQHGPNEIEDKKTNLLPTVDNSQSHTRRPVFISRK